MTLCLDLVLVADRYDAGGGQDPRVPEWPPHPGRVHSALLSVAEPDDLPSLRVLENLSPPTIRASREAFASQSRSYVVTNSRSREGGNLNHPGRTSGLRQRRSVFPRSPRVQLIWTDDDGVSDHDVRRLDAMARRVPYLGRSTSPVMMGVERLDQPVDLRELDVYLPSDGGDLRLRVPYPGHIDELTALYEQGLPAWQASEGGRAWQVYQLVNDDPSPVAPLASPYQDLVVLRFRDRRPAGRALPVFTAALRSMVMSQTSEPLPPALHGHGFEGRPHVAYLGLPFCGAPHADGHLVGLAVAIPGMQENERRRILRGLLGPSNDGSVWLRVRGYREPFELEYRPEERLPRSASAWHWSRPARHWVSVSPIVLDRYPKDGDVADAVRQSAVLAGLPEPSVVDVSTEAMTIGAIRLSPAELPRRARGRLYRHARITFDHPVSGPLLVGAGRYFGVGLMQPERRSEENANAPT